MAARWYAVRSNCMEAAWWTVVKNDLLMTWQAKSRGIGNRLWQKMLHCCCLLVPKEEIVLHEVKM